MKQLYDLVRSKIVARKELRYLVSGGLSVIIEYISFLLLILVSSLFISNSVSFLIGIASGFVFHKLWSFAGDQHLKTTYQIISYSIVAAVNFVATNLIISFLVNSAGLGPALAKLITMVVVAAWTFVIFNKLVFRHRTTSETKVN